MDVQDEEVSISNNLPLSTQQLPNHNNTAVKYSICKKLWYAIAGIMIVMLTAVYLNSRSYLLLCYYQDEDLELHQLLYDNISNINDDSRLSVQERLQQIWAQSQPHSKYKATKQAYLAYSLYNNITDPIYPQIEKHYLQSKYHISQYTTHQLPLCVVSAGRNLVYQSRYKGYLNSLARQEYANYRVILVDDNSDDGTIQAINQYLNISTFHALRERVTVVSNQQRKYALYSKDLAITQHCSPTDIIVQVDPDDQLIGNQVFATMNAVYSANSSIWAMYSSYIYWHPECGCPTEGISASVPAKVLQEGTYRYTTQFYTSATKTYRRQLYDKIDKKDFMGQHGQYHKWTSDLFVHYSLVELAGIQHYHFIHEVFYFYHLDHNKYNRVEKAISRLDALSLQPYNKLSSLTDKPSRKVLPKNMEWIDRKKRDLQNCIATRNQENCDVSI